MKRYWINQPHRCQRPMEDGSTPGVKAAGRRALIPEVCLLALLLAAGCSAPPAVSAIGALGTETHALSSPAPMETPLPRTSAGDASGAGTVSTSPEAPSTPSPASTSAPLPQATKTPEPTPFTFVWVTDTQLMTAEHPEYLMGMFSWIGENAGKLNIVGLLHTGDLVQGVDREYQWERIDEAFAFLPEDMVVFSVMGNHDQTDSCVNYDAYLRHRPDSQGVLYSDDLSASSLTCDFGGVRLLLLGAGYKHEKDNLDWLRAQAETYPDRTAILLSHSYLSNTDRALSSSGRILWKGLVRDTPNIRLVLSGHLPGTWRLQSDRGETVPPVWQLTYNPQYYPNGGGAYLRLLTFDPQAESVSVVTYSPVLEDYNYFSESTDSFSLSDLF